MQEHDVVGIGNAIVDIIGRCDDAFLARHGCAKGSMQLVDAAAVAQALRRHGAGRGDLRRLGRQHHGRHRLVRRPGRLHRQDRRRPVRAGVRPRHPHGRRDLHDAPAAAGQRADRPLPGAGDAGRPAHHEHVPGRQPAARRRRGRRRADRLGAHRLSRGLPVRPARGQGRIPPGRRDRRQGRTAGGAQPVRCLLRRPAPGRVPAS